MNTGLIATVSVTIAAPAADVWEAGKVDRGDWCEDHHPRRSVKCVGGSRPARNRAAVQETGARRRCSLKARQDWLTSPDKFRNGLVREATGS